MSLPFSRIFPQGHVKFRPWLIPVLVLAVALLAATSFMGWRHLSPVQAAKSWRVSVYLDRIPRVSALAFDEGGKLYVTQEFRNGKGVLLQIDSEKKRQKIVTGLSKPDGLTPFMGGIAIGQEGGRLPVLLLRNGKTETLFMGNNVEGLASDAHSLFAIEDIKRGGRLLKYDPATQDLKLLRDGLQTGEGVAACPNGDLFYAEKKKGWIKKFQPQGQDKIVASNLNEPGFLMCNDDGLWITEDATHLARLLLLDQRGVLQTILSHLRSAQTILPLGPGRLLLAEQGRERILELTYSIDAK